jgi:ketosteroid isomerase-like protein
VTTVIRFAFNLDVRHEPPIEVHAIGDLVVVRGGGGGTATPKAGGPAMTFDNKMMMLYRRQPDGSLRVGRVVYNTKAPPAPPAPAKKK